MIRKLTEDDVRLIRELHAWKLAEMKRLNRTVSLSVLAEKFGVHVCTIQKVLSYNTWKRV